MKRLIVLAMATLMMCSSAFAGGIFITISGNGGQIKTEAQEFRYSKSPSDLAGGSSSMAAAGPATSARGGGGGRAAGRRMNEPVVIVHKVDESSPFFVKAAASGETLTSVVFEFKRPVGTGTEVFQTVTLTNAIVTSVKTINGGIQPMEEVSFTFQKIAYENKDGAAAAPASWN
jgi:type VI secretion system Hcp family effector